MEGFNMREVGQAFRSPALATASVAAPDRRLLRNAVWINSNDFAMRAPKSITSEQTRPQHRVFALRADEIPSEAVANIWPALVQDIARPRKPSAPAGSTRLSSSGKSVITKS